MIRSPSSNNNHDMRYTNRDLQDHRKDEESSMSCEMEVSGDKIRAGHHDTRGKLKSTTCRLILRGRVYDTVHVSLVSYNLRYFNNNINNVPYMYFPHFYS